MQALRDKGLMAPGAEVLIVQSSDSSAWGFECNHALMLYNIP